MLPKKNPLHYSSIYSWLVWYLPLVVNFTAGMVVASPERAPSTSGLSLGFLPLFPLMARSWCSAELPVSVNCGSQFSCQLPLFLVYFVSILVLSFILFFFFLLWWCCHLPAVCLLFSLPALLALLYLIHWIEKKKAWSINVLYDDYNLI